MSEPSAPRDPSDSTGSADSRPQVPQRTTRRRRANRAFGIVLISWGAMLVGLLLVLVARVESPAVLLPMGLALAGWLVGTVMALTALLGSAAAEEPDMGSVSPRWTGALSALLGILPLIFVAYYFWMHSKHNPGGRVLRIGGRKGRAGRPRLPERARGTGWQGELSVPTDSLSAAERAVLGEAWLMAARTEQASVPAFARLSLDLVALGAPSDLVERCHLAALDEIDHARRCYAVASAFSGVSFTAGPLPALLTEPAAPEKLKEKIERIDSLARLAAASLQDGALAEGTATRIAEVAAQAAVLPALRETLSCIARDEREHAELAWDILHWCLATGGNEVRRAVEQTLRVIATGSSSALPLLPPLPGITEAQLEAHGVLSKPQLDRIAQLSLQETLDRAAVLLDPPSRAAA